jgi:hypothetical protein
MKYNVTTTDVKKVTVSITRKQLWDNYVDCWKDCAWDNCIGLDSLEQVRSVLTVDSELDFLAVRNLFRRGDTVMLMGDAMEFLDAKDILREVVVLDPTHNNVIHIRHEDINF